MSGPVAERTLFSIFQLLMHDLVTGTVTRSSFSDGILLCSIVKKVGDCMEIKDTHEHPNSKAQKRHNISAALKLIKMVVPTMPNVKADDVITGNDKLVKALLSLFCFGLNKKLVIRGHHNHHTDACLNLKDWLNNILNPDIHINNFTTDWYSGTTLGALIDHISPGLCPDWRHFQASSNIENVTMLLQLAEKHLQVYRVITAADMCDTRVEPQTIVFYLSQFVDATVRDDRSERSGSIALPNGSFSEVRIDFALAFCQEPSIPLETTSGATGSTWIAKTSRHPNVISMVGVIMLDKHPSNCYLIPVSDRRDLHTHLETKRLSAAELISFALDIAKGAKHIINTIQSFTTLTTRNCILSEDGQSVMVADYRQVRHILPHDYLLETSEMYQPWRWQAIENLNGDKHPSIWSHVWSLAVVYHELFTNGRRPYCEIRTEHQLREWLNQGRRLERPQQAPEEMWELMRVCWNRNPKERPTFDDVIPRIRRMLPPPSVPSKSLDNTFDPDRTLPKVCGSNGYSHTPGNAYTRDPVTSGHGRLPPPPGSAGAYERLAQPYR